MLVFHQRGVQLRSADRKRLSWLLRGGNGRRLEQRRQSPVGNPRQPFDQFVVIEDNIFAGRLNALQVSKGEWIAERNGGPRGLDGQSKISWTNLRCRQPGPIADLTRRMGRGLLRGLSVIFCCR